MPNFALVRPVGGQSRPLSAYMQDRTQEHDADAQRQIRDMQMQDAQQKTADREVLRNVVQRSGGDWEKASKDALAAGASPEAVMSLQDRARGESDRAYTDKQRGQADSDRQKKEAVDRLAVAGKIDELAGQVTDQQSYDLYRQGATELARQYGIQANIPETYDPAYIEAKRKTAQAVHSVWKTLSPQEEAQMGLDPSGTYQVNKSGEMKTIVKPKSEQKSVEQWGAMSPQDAQAAGFPEGSVIQRSNRGRLSAAYTPKGGGAGGGGPAPTNSRKQYDEMVALGMPEDVARATAYGTYRQVTDVMGNMSLVDVASGRVVGHMEDNDKGGVKWVPEQAPVDAGGADALPAAAASQLQEGHITTFGNGQQWTLQGGKQVRIK